MRGNVKALGANRLWQQDGSPAPRLRSHLAAMTHPPCLLVMGHCSIATPDKLSTELCHCPEEGSVPFHAGELSTCVSTFWTQAGLVQLLAVRLTGCTSIRLSICTWVPWPWEVT